MKIGDTVRIIGIPKNLPDDDLGTRTLFERCLNRAFPIAGFNEYGMIELQVGAAVGEPSWKQTIWIEPEFLEPVAS